MIQIAKFNIDDLIPPQIVVAEMAKTATEKWRELGGPESRWSLVRLGVHSGRNLQIQKQGMKVKIPFCPLSDAVRFKNGRKSQRENYSAVEVRRFDARGDRFVREAWGAWRVCLAIACNVSGLT